MRPAKRSSNLGLILIAGLVIGLLIAAYVFRGVISRTVPGADVIYALLHLSTDSPAADLEISNFVAKITHDESTGQNVIDLSATIFNLSEYPVNVPTLMVIPIDEVNSQRNVAVSGCRAVSGARTNLNFKKSSTIGLLMRPARCELGLYAPTCLKGLHTNLKSAYYPFGIGGALHALVGSMI